MTEGTTQVRRVPGQDHVLDFTPSASRHDDGPIMIFCLSIWRTTYFACCMHNNLPATAAIGELDIQACYAHSPSYCHRRISPDSVCQEAKQRDNICGLTARNQNQMEALVKLLSSCQLMICSDDMTQHNCGMQRCLPTLEYVRDAFWIRARAGRPTGCQNDHSQPVSMFN